MSCTIMVVPTGVGVGLPTVAQGLQRVFINQGLRAHYFKPVEQTNVTYDVVREQQTILHPDKPIPFSLAQSYLSSDRREELLEQIVAAFHQQTKSYDVVIVQGLIATQETPYVARLNARICKALDAKVVLVASPGHKSARELSEQIEIFSRSYGGVTQGQVLGIIINKMNAPLDQQGHFNLDNTLENAEILQQASDSYLEQCCVIHSKQMHLLGVIPWNRDLVAPRVSDIVRFLQADALYPGEMMVRRVQTMALCARSVANIPEILKPGTLVITAGDRHDIIIATSMAALTGIKIAALLLTGGYQMLANVSLLCDKAFQSGLPVLSVTGNSFHTAVALQNLDREIPADDLERMELARNYVARCIDKDWVKNVLDRDYERHLSPPAFRYLLTEKARKANKRIVLPEGEEPRTIEAAAICAKRGIARCVLIGEEHEIRQIAQQHGIVLDKGIEIVKPWHDWQKYAAVMVSLRQHKGMTEVVAKDYLQDNVVLATMMLQQGEVDGLVSGALHTTANTIRPALQFIKTAPGVKLVSSIFFMCLPDQVLVYGDCAVNPNPNADELADIAIQSADSAAALGIEPRIAMISYSTGASGQGQDVDKVRLATELVQQRRPDLLVDGPLQYDAALINSVAQSKAPNSQVAGRATVIIFPDLNTGNTTYKAVQRSANVLSIGPMLQGLAKPVNDLSRGALVDDIVYTIALTAIQAA
jgi:phosphate acetyltransferase